MLSLVQSLVLLLQDSYVSCINIMHLTNEQLRYSKLKDLVLPLEEQGETPVVVAVVDSMFYQSAVGVYTTPRFTSSWHVIPCSTTWHMHQLMSTLR